MRSEIERMMGAVARASLRQNMPNRFEGLFTERPVKILPPFLGEMGIEIIHFLARVEPYLRNGWRILAKRPAFYPPGTAFYDPAYFDRLNPLIAQYGLHPARVGLRQPMQRADKYFHTQVLRGTPEEIELRIRYESPQVLIQESQFELQARDLFYSYCDLDKRGIIDIDTFLLSCQPTRLEEEFVSVRPVLLPSYRPSAFLLSGPSQAPHIGVQLRALAKTGKHPSGGLGRDSDPTFVLPLAERAALMLGLPLLIYGRPEGNFLPEGYAHTYEPDIDLLDKELRLLPACRLMFAPDSGWADLMAWLQVPTLLEGSAYSGHFDELIGFEPRLALIDRERPIEPQIEALLASDMCIPNDTRGQPSYRTELHTRNFLGL